MITDNLKAIVLFLLAGSFFSGTAFMPTYVYGGGDVFPDVGEMIFIPGGEFIMGASEEEGVVGIEVGVDAMPKHRIYLKPFYIDKYEVTVAQYKKFMSATGRPQPLLWGPDYAAQYPSVRDNDPISDISWYDADTYCRWVDKRLPTEQEWEKAARGTDGRRFPWGNEWKDDISNSWKYSREHNKDNDGKFTHTVTEVGTLKGDVSPYGVYDMAGNVLEWTSSWYKPYPGNELKRNLFGEKVKVLRGGSWMAPPVPFSFVFNRHFGNQTGDDPYYGVRCAKD